MKDRRIEKLLSRVSFNYIPSVIIIVWNWVLNNAVGIEIIGMREMRNISYKPQEDICNSLCETKVKAGAASAAPESMLIVFIPRALGRLYWIIQMKIPATVCCAARSANICYIQLLCSNTRQLG